MKRGLICWDSSVLIDWILGEKSSHQERIPAIRPVVEYVDSGHYQLVVSTLVYVEVLERAMSPVAMEKFSEFMKNREKIRQIAVDVRVAKKAQEIRNRIHGRSQNKKISTPDAIHIATTIISGATLFHTFDDDLVALSGKDEIEGLAITRCDIPGATLSMSF